MLNHFSPFIMILLLFGIICFIMLWQKERQEARKWEGASREWQERYLAKREELAKASLQNGRLTIENASLKVKVEAVESHVEVLESDETLLKNLMQYLQLVKDYDRDRRDRVCQEIEEMLLMEGEEEDLCPCCHRVVEK